MNLLSFKRQLQFTQRQHRLQSMLKATYPNLPSAFFQEQQFKFSALSLRKQNLFAKHLILSLLARDKIFHISGKMQRALRAIYSVDLLKTIAAHPTLAWDKLDVLSTFTAMTIDHDFINASKIALLKIMYADFYAGDMLAFLLTRYHLRRYQYASIIDSFWLQFSVAEIQFAAAQVMGYLFCSFKTS